MIPFSKPKITTEDVEYVKKAVESTWISGGKYIEELEDYFTQFEGFRNPILTSNGTSALQLAFLSAGLQPGDKVIFPSFCFQAGANVALQMGLKPIFIDVDLSTMNIDQHNIGTILLGEHPSPKAVVVVHNYGYPCDMKSIMELTDKHKVLLIEDCAEALFSEVDRDWCGTYGDIATFSFHATKTITTGEGGMMITSDDDIARKARLYKSHGLEVRGTYNHILPGNNFRMSNINAALGLSQVKRWNDIFNEKFTIHTLYKGFLCNQEGITVPYEVPNSETCLWSMPVILNPDYFNRDEIIEKMLELGVETRPGFVSAGKLDYFDCRYNSYYADYLSENVIVLPAWLGLDIYDIQEICEKLLSLRSK